ncbi:hypothetical protein BKA67DRAFT_587234, partial [Truncatella angustata]
RVFPPRWVFPAGGSNITCPPSPIRRTSNCYWDDVQTGGMRTHGSDTNGRACFPTESRLDTDLNHLAAPAWYRNNLDRHVRRL